MLLVSQLEPLSGTVAIVESTGRVADALDALLQEKRDDGPNINLPDSLGPLAPDAEKMLEAVVMLPDLVVQRATTSDDLDQLKDQARAGELVEAHRTGECLLVRNGELRSDQHPHLAAPGNEA